MTEGRSPLLLAFLIAVPSCALLGGLVGWASFGVPPGSAADAVHAGNDSVQPALELAAGAGALVWNTLVGLAGALVGALSGLAVAPLAVAIVRRARGGGRAASG